jgi:plasmid stabilization system protein ParE
MHFAPHRTIKLTPANDDPRSGSEGRFATAESFERQAGSFTIHDAVRGLISRAADGHGVPGRVKRVPDSVAVWSGKLPLRIMARGRRDLVEIHRYTAEAYSEDRGQAYLRELEAALDLLAAYPSLGRAVDAHVRRLVRGKHIVLYRVVIGVVVIDRIFHGAQRQ